MLFIRFVLISMLFLLTSCQSKRDIYDWDSYNSSVANILNGSSDLETQIISMENQIKQNKNLPPGFYIQLSMLYSQSNTQFSQKKAIMYLKKEKQNFPESDTFVNFLLKEYEK